LRRESAARVAGDGDLAEYCASSKNLIRLARPAEFIDLFLRQTAFIRLVEESAAERVDQIREAVRAKFEELGVSLDDEQGWGSEDKMSIPIRSIRQRLVRRFYRAVVHHGRRGVWFGRRRRFSIVGHTDNGQQIW
jgi:hypothetical protein